MFIYLIYSLFGRTTTNITLIDDDEENSNNTIESDSTNTLSEETEDDTPHMKRKRTSSNSEQRKLYETITKTLNDNHIRKIEIMQQAMQTKPTTELDLFFASIGKTMEKLHAIDQAKIKLQISQIVSQYEMALLEEHQVADTSMLSYQSHSQRNQELHRQYDGFYEKYDNLSINENSTLTRL